MPTTIVLTGGPCGGKTTALSKLTERLEDFGHRVLCIPETATMLLKSGMTLDYADDTEAFQVQEAILRAIINLENTFKAIANAKENVKDKTVIICDRGTMDNKAFCKPVVWQSILDNVGTTEGKLRDGYDAVIHMVTAAEGAEEFYTLDNNNVRTETPEQSRAIDKAIQDAWVGHPHLRVADNSTGFDEKVQKVISHVCRVVGVPEPIENERKFLVKFTIEKTVPTPRFHWVNSRIVQDYLITSDGSEARVRMRETQGHRSYTHNVKIRRGKGSAIERERRLTPSEYISLLSTKDPERATIQKNRMCFMWEGQYIELDTFDHLYGVEGVKELQILEIEVEDLAKEVVIPPFVEVIRDVTEDPTMSNYAMAKRAARP